MEDSDRRLLNEAFAFALEVHGVQTRRGVDIPYASHLLQVAGLVLEAGGDLTQAAAALLHDTLEDCPGVDELSLGMRFGADVAALVKACSDLLPGDRPGDKAPWTLRKRQFLSEIAGATPRAQQICACDKLHNLRSLIADLRAHGVGTLERFNAEPEQIRWYYESAGSILIATLPPPLALEFENALTALRSFVPEARAPEGSGI